MPALGAENDTRAIKLMVVGHSGAGKTGALVSLVKAGFVLRICDLDMGLDILYHQVKEHCPDKLSNVSYMQFRDKIKMTSAGPVVNGAPRAFADLMKALDKWEDDTVPSEWDRNTIVVIDSLTAVGRAAFLHARHMNPTAKEPRTWYFSAQDMIESFLANLTNEEFNPNVIVNTHIDVRELADGRIEGLPSSIGAALGPKIPRYFNNLIVAEASGTGTNAKRTLRTVPTNLISNVKVPKPLDVTYPIESGLAAIFQKLRS